MSEKQKYLEEVNGLLSFLRDSLEDYINETELDDLPAPEVLVSEMLNQVLINPDDLPEYEPLIAEIERENVMFEIDEDLALPLYPSEDNNEYED